MFATYDEFKDALKKFHPEKIGYIYCTLNYGWIDNEDSTIYKVKENNGIWELWFVKEKPEFHIDSVIQNDALQTRNVLHRLDVIALEDYWKELCDDQDLDYP